MYRGGDRGTYLPMKLLIIALSFFAWAANAYVEEEVHFPVGNGIALTGYVAKPEAQGKHPILVLQMGHGQGTTDSKTRSYNPFAEMSRKLADQGFVVLRFDKRGTGYNSGNGSFADGTFSDYISDLKAAIRSMQQRKDTSNNEVYLFGHSLGGPIISIAAHDIPEVKGIILSASPGRIFAEFNLEQMRYLLELGQGLSGEPLNTELAKVARSIQLITEPETFCREFPADCEKKNSKIYLWGQSSQFWSEIAALNPLAPLKNLRCKLFAIHGTSDWVVSSSNDGGAIAQAMAGNSNFSAITLNGLDHFLLNMDSKKASVDLFMGGLKDENIKIHPQFIPTVADVLEKWTSDKN